MHAEAPRPLDRDALAAHVAHAGNAARDVGSVADRIDDGAGRDTRLAGEDALAQADALQRGGPAFADAVASAQLAARAARRTARDLLDTHRSVD